MKQVLDIHAPYVESSFYDYAAIARDLDSWGAVGLGCQFFSAGQIAQTDAAGNKPRQLHPPQDMALSLGYAHALDVGLLSPAYWQDRIRLAAVAANPAAREFGPAPRPPCRPPGAYILNDALFF